MKTVSEKNVVIAKWMGDKEYVLSDPKWIPSDGENYLKYHTSWDWLMPAIKKWDTILIPGTASEYFNLCTEMDNAVTNNYDISEAFEQLYKCIEWYNKQVK